MSNINQSLEPDKKNAAELILTFIRRIRLRRCPSYIDKRATASTGNFTKI
jgi:hypothetical protein